MFTYVTICNDEIGYQYLSDDNLELFSTKDEAFIAALKAAEEEVDSLNGDFVEDKNEESHSYYISTNDALVNHDAVKVLKQYVDNGENVTLTLREIKEIKPNLSQEIKDMVIDMVHQDLETGQVEGDYKSIVRELADEFLDNGNIYIGLAKEAAEYYLNLANLGPVGFYEEFPDLDWSKEYIDEYGYNDDCDDEDGDDEDEDE